MADRVKTHQVCSVKLHPLLVLLGASRSARNRFEGVSQRAGRVLLIKGRYRLLQRVYRFVITQI